MSDAIFFPDVSDYQRGLVIQPNTVFVWAKATEGTTVVDTAYQNFKTQAASVGAKFGAYHVLHAGNGSAQADHAFAVVGSGVPLFVDVEQVGTSYPTTVDVEAFTARYRALGGICEVMYYPKWYWTNQGSPSLSVTGLKLIASGYAGYSDTAANWDAYGGVTPFQWQFSDNFAYGGMLIDFNAYKGTLAEYLVAIGATSSAPTNPTPVEDDDMTAASNAQGVAGLSWSTGTKHALQLVADGALGALPTVRAVFVYDNAGAEVVSLSTWVNGRLLLDPIPNYLDASGVILEAQGGDTTPYFAFAS
jgi:hypothetical protein